MLPNAVHAIEAHGTWVHTAARAVGFALVIVAVLLIKMLRKNGDSNEPAKA
ncbi:MULTISPECIES: hypothetical protein [unclassified Variovorax]|uniref:hypothetical protein n=1 Tax=unclassified Variovorax TaxID=663243 RepID=UPI003ECE1F47